MTHTAVTLVAALFSWYVFGYDAAGLIIAAVYIGREHAQAEYRWINTYGRGFRRNMPWWGGFDHKVWNLKSLLDWFLPLIVAVAIIEVV